MSTMKISWCVAWLAVSVLAVGFAEPTPQPSVEPSTTVAATTATPPSSTTSDTSDLTEEGQDQVAILKQINRVNDDGSYTFGYEAADGSFKIETRDVAGNVKGMFGFVDEGGELKRVSYSASNGTGFQSTGSPNVPPLVQPDDGESPTRLPFPSPRPDSTTRISLLPPGTTERNLPVYIYHSTTRAPRPEVIQHIPKLRPTPGSITTEPTESEEVTTNIRRPTYGSFLPRKSSTPSYITLKPTTPAPDEDSEKPTRRPAVVQIIRPRGFKKVLVTKRPLDVSTTSAPSSTTEYYPVTYASQLSEDEEAQGESQRQIDSNSVTEVGLATSGTEDSPDVFGGGPTARPYPAGAYRTLFSPLPQYQRILQTSYLQNQNQYLAAGADSRLPPPIPGQGYNPYGNQGQQPPRNPNIPNRYQDPAAIAQFAQLPFPQGGGRGQQLPFPSGPGSQDLPYPPDARQYQGLAFPSGRQNIPQLPPPGVSPQDYPQQGPVGRGYPEPFAQPGPAPPAGAIPYPQGPGQNQGPGPIGRQPQTLPAPTYNPSQGIVPSGPAQNNGEEGPRRPPPVPPTYNQAYPNGPQYGPEQPNPAYFMEQLIRMLLAARQQPQGGPPQQQLTPFQQALISTLGANNVPQELLGRNYDPRYQNYGPYQQRAPLYPQQQYDPRYNQHNGYSDPYAQAPYRYNPYYQPNPYQGYNPNPYQGYNAGYNQGFNPNPGYNPGFSPNPYYQGGPEEALLRMFLGGRFPPAPPAPQPSPQIQNSPAAFDRSPYGPRQPIGPEGQASQGPVFGQRIPVPGNIVERSSGYSQREAPTPRSPSSRAKGSRNVQILDPVASESTTTSKPR